MFLKGPVCIPLMTCSHRQRYAQHTKREMDRTHARLQIYQDSSWYISGIVALVEEDVFSVAALGRKVF